MNARASMWRDGAIVFVLALALRVALLPSARFGGDEALFFSIASNIVDGRAFPALGTQLTDGAARLPGPAFLYLMAAPLLLWGKPDAQFLFTEVLGACSVLLFWLAMRAPFGERGARWAALLMACAPWSALFADRTWNPNVLAFFICLAMWCAVRMRAQPTTRATLLFVPAAAVLAQLHMSAPVAWAGLLVLVAPSARAVSRRRWLAAFGLAALLYAPFIGHEVVTGFSNTRNVIAETVGEKKERHEGGALWVPVYAARFLTLDATYHELSGYWGGPNERACIEALWRGSAPRPAHPLRLLALAASMLLLALSLWVCLRAAWRGRRTGPAGGNEAPPQPVTLSPRVFAFAFVATLLTNMALIGLAHKQVFGHYVINMLPFAFVLYARAAEIVAARRGWRRAVAAVLTALFCLGGIETTLSISRRVDGRIGLRVHDQTMAAILADRQAHAVTERAVRLDFRYRSTHYEWNIFAERAAHADVRFARSAPWHYLLVERDKKTAVPDGALGPIDVGFAKLYRLGPARTDADNGRWP